MSTVKKFFNLHYFWTGVGLLVPGLSYYYLNRKWHEPTA